jgi:GDP-L-fucose synthase
LLREKSTVHGERIAFGSIVLFWHFVFNFQRRGASMETIAGQRVLVTGGAGFLGREVCRALEAYRPAAVLVPRSFEYDLRDAAAVRRLLRDTRPNIVVHLAAVVGGISANRANPGSFFYENAIMGIQLLEEARLAQVDKFVVLGTVCAYPKFTAVPFREDDLWNGYPEETNAPYGLAKKMLIVQAQAYRQQYGMNAISLLPVNLYGPGDNFDLDSSHVLPALIRKAVEAREAGRPFIEVWGTGSASREFLFVRDAARAIVAATELYDKPEPVNIGSGQEISIRELVELICKACRFEGGIRWDLTKPDGQPRRCLDTTRAAADFGFRARTSLVDGLRETVAWYETNALAAGDEMSAADRAASAHSIA